MNTEQLCFVILIAILAIPDLLKIMNTPSVSRVPVKYQKLLDTDPNDDLS